MKMNSEQTLQKRQEGNEDSSGSPEHKINEQGFMVAKSTMAYSNDASKKMNIPLDWCLAIIMKQEVTISLRKGSFQLFNIKFLTMMEMYFKILCNPSCCL